MRYRIIGKKGLKTTNLNRKRAIRHHCRMCSDFRWSDVLQCHRVDCPLHPFRAGNLQEKGLCPAQRRHAIKAFCTGCAGDDEQERLACDAPECALFPYRNG
jgi:hypothetical protein